MADAPDDALTVDELAALLKLPRSTTYEALKYGRIPVPQIKIGKHLRVSRAAVLAWLAGGSPAPRSTGRKAG